MPFFVLSWSESKCATVEAESESAARQWWIDGLDESVEIETYEAQMIEVYESNEKGEKL
jgi:hypothetical protein